MIWKVGDAIIKIILSEAGVLTMAGIIPLSLKTLLVRYRGRNRLESLLHVV